MTEKELRKLNRRELLEMLLEQTKETERLRDALQKTAEKLQNRELMVQEAGSVAEASLRLNGVFEAAQQAADQYLENIRRQSGEVEAKCQAMEAETRSKCDRMLEDAKRQADAHWQNSRKKLEAFVAQQQGLREILLALFPKNGEQE